MGDERSSSGGPLPPQGHILMLRLLGGGVEDALAAVDLHTHVQLEVDVALGGGAAEAAAGRRAGPALAEELTHGGEARRLPVGQLAEGEKRRRRRWRKTRSRWRRRRRRKKREVGGGGGRGRR